MSIGLELYSTVICQEDSLNVEADTIRTAVTSSTVTCCVVYTYVLCRCFTVLCTDTRLRSCCCLEWTSLIVTSVMLAIPDVDCVTLALVVTFVVVSGHMCRN
jgi:hypothetical protein